MACPLPQSQHSNSHYPPQTRLNLVHKTRKPAKGIIMRVKPRDSVLIKETEMMSILDDRRWRKYMKNSYAKRRSTSLKVPGTDFPKDLGFSLVSLILIFDKARHRLKQEIGNLFTEQVTKRDIFYVFHKYGRLAQISMKSAYGFVQYHDSQSCMRALQSEQGIEIRGRKISNGILYMALV